MGNEPPNPAADNFPLYDPPGGVGSVAPSEYFGGKSFDQLWKEYRAGQHNTELNQQVPQVPKTTRGESNNGFILDNKSNFPDNPALQGS